MERELLMQIINLSGMTQIEMQEKTGFPQPHISRWVKGTRTPKLSTIIEIAEKLGYKIELSITKDLKC